MKRFRLLKQTRQTTEYSCGASALQAVMSYWGKDVDEEELMRLLGTTPEEGTYPEELVRVARSQGFEAELKDNLTIEEVERATARAMAESTAQAAAEGDFGLSVKDPHRIADKLSPEHSANIVLFGNLRERKFREISAKNELGHAFSRCHAA